MLGKVSRLIFFPNSFNKFNNTHLRSSISYTLMLSCKAIQNHLSRIMTKPTKWHVRPWKTQISLGIRPVWSESSLCAQWVAMGLSFLHADSKDSDQTGRMSRLVRVFAGRTCHFVGFVTMRLIWSSNFMKRLNFLLAEAKTPEYEPRHDKTYKVSVRPAKTQISLGIRPVWSESSLSAWRNLGSLATHWAHSENSDQTGRMPWLIWVFAGRTATLLVLTWGGSDLYILNAL